MSDEKTYPARTIVKAIQHLRTLSLDDMISQDMIDMDRVIEQMPPSNYRVVLTNVGLRTIGAIKIVRDRSRIHPAGVGLGLAESKALVDTARDGGRPTVLTTPDKVRALDMVDAFKLNESDAHIETDY